MSVLRPRHPASRTARLVFPIAVGAASVARPAAAQLASLPRVPPAVQASASPDLDAPVRPARGPFVRPRDLVVFGGLLAAAGAVAPADTRIARWSQRPGLHDSGVPDAVMRGARTVGGAGTVVLPLVAYGVGLVARDRAVAQVGLETGAAVVAAAAVTEVVKGVAGRARPYVSGDRRSGDFAFGRGFRRGDAYQAFPSGHATASFALAAALEAEGRVRWPGVNRVTGPLGFAAASVVAASRLYHNQHWASDVLVGAGVGTVFGGAVTRYALARPDIGLEGRLLPRAARGRGPVALSWSLAF